MLTGGSRTFTWDADNRLDTVTASGGSLVMAYDYTGIRVKKTGSTGTTYFPFSGYQIEPDGVITKYFRIGTENIAAKKSTGEKLFYHNDHLGGVNIITNDLGIMAQIIEYDPWGKVSRDEGIGDSVRRFTGKQLDPESGPYYYGGRYYDPELGRFISPDPFVPQPGDPQSFNRYSYVENNPVNKIDPSGYKSFWKKVGRFFKKAFKAILGNPIGRIITAGLFAVASYGAFTALTGFAFHANVAAVVGLSASSAQAVMEIPPVRNWLARAGPVATLAFSLGLNMGFNYAYAPAFAEAGTVHEVNYKESPPPQDTQEASATFKGDEITRHAKGSELSDVRNITHEIRVGGELRAIARVSDATGIPTLHAHVAASGLTSSVVTPPNPLFGYMTWFGTSHQAANINLLASGLSNTISSLTSNVGQAFVFATTSFIYGPYGGGAILNPAFNRPLYGNHDQR